MTRAIKYLVCIEETPYHHITSCCVRRSSLCGYDNQSSHDYEHCCGWIEEHIHILSSISAIEFAPMPSPDLSRPIGDTDTPLWPN